jgi:uncharacterized protein
MSPRFRILALDGGGVRGAFSASVLACLEAELRQPVAEHFDLITGTSTGGIIALGLAAGLTAGEIRDFYLSRAKDIFPGAGLVHRAHLALRHLFAPRRSQERLRQALQSVLGDRKLGDSRNRLVIPSYDAVAGRLVLLIRESRTSRKRPWSIARSPRQPRRPSSAPPISRSRSDRSTWTGEYGQTVLPWSE